MKIDYLKIITGFVKNIQVQAESGKSESGLNSRGQFEVNQSLTVKVGGKNEEIKTAQDSKNIIKANDLTGKNSVLIENQEIKFNSINRLEQAKLMKELLNLPAEIEELFSFLMYKKISSQDLEKLFKQNQKIDIDLIKQFLEGNSKESLNKLLKLFQQAPGGVQNADQIKDILALLSQFSPKKEAASNEILTNLTLLYLPWLPLSEKQDLEIRIEKRKHEEKEESEQIVLVMYITTINLGRFKISFVLNKDNSLKIEIECIETEKKEDQKEFLENILKEINAQTRKDKVKANTDLIVISETKEFYEEKKREVIISPSKEISPVLVITAQKIAKIILENDEKISLLEKRKELKK